MSRYSCIISTNPKISLNFGSDHALGYFYDIFNEDEEEIIEEKCTMFNKLTSKQLLEVLAHKIPTNLLALYASKMEKLAGDLEI